MLVKGLFIIPIFNKFFGFFELLPVKYTREIIKIMLLRYDFDILVEPYLLAHFVVFLSYKILYIHQ